MITSRSIAPVLALIALLSAGPISFVPSYAEAYEQVHESDYFIWYSPPEVVQRYRQEISAHYEFADMAYRVLTDLLGVDIVTLLGRKVGLYISPLPGGGWAGGGSLGLSYDAFISIYSGKTTWAHVLIAHELVNVFTSIVVEEWPRDWWANHISPFPFAMTMLVLERTGHADALPRRQEEARRIGPAFQQLVELFLRLYSEDPGIYGKLLRTVLQDQWKHWTQVSRGSNPSKRLSEYVVAYLSMSAGRNLYSEINGALKFIAPGYDEMFGVDPIEVFRIWHTRMKIAHLPRNAPEWDRFRRGEAWLEPPLLVIDVGVQDVRLRINGREVLSGADGLAYYSEPGRDSFVATIDLQEYYYVGERVRLRLSAPGHADQGILRVNVAGRVSLKLEVQMEYAVDVKGSRLTPYGTSVPVIDTRYWVVEGTHVEAFAPPTYISISDRSRLALKDLKAFSYPILNMSDCARYQGRRVWLGERRIVESFNLTFFFRATRCGDRPVGDGFAVIMAAEAVSGWVSYGHTLGYQGVSRSAAIGFWFSWGGRIGLMENGVIPADVQRDPRLRPHNTMAYLDDRWHRLTINVEGSRVKVSVDGNLVGEFTLSATLREIVGRDVLVIGLSGATGNDVIRLEVGMDAGDSVRSPVTILAYYSMQHFVNVSTLFGSAVGSGWYDHGTTAVISVPDDLIQVAERERYVLAGWLVGGTLVPGRSVSLRVTEPVTVAAEWRREFLVRFVTVPGEIRDDVFPEAEKWIAEGMRIDLSPPSDLRGGEGVRYVLKSVRPSGSIIVESPVDLIAVYERLYLLRVVDEMGLVGGEEWRREGETVRLWMPTTSIGFLVKRVFAGWRAQDGNTYNVNPYEFVITSPETIYAIWRTDYTELLMLAGILGGVAAGLALMRHGTPLRKKKETEQEFQ